jgi:hypothetical protein
MSKTIPLFLCVFLCGCASLPRDNPVITPSEHPESDQAWRAASVQLWTGGRFSGDLRWLPGRKSYEIIIRGRQPEVQICIEETEVAWISLPDGTIWKDYR